MFVTKRDGRKAEFDKEKIVSAILKAYESVDNKITDESLRESRAIAMRIQSMGKDMSVEEIQDIVEQELMKTCRKDVAKEYIVYRNNRNRARKSKEYGVIDSIVRVESNEITKENANMNAETPAGMMMKLASESSKAYSTDCLLSKEANDAYKNNYIHPHDLDYWLTKSTTCVQHPLDKLLRDGFMETRPAKRIETAGFFGCISMETSQNEQHT